MIGQQDSLAALKLEVHSGAGLQQADRVLSKGDFNYVLFLGNAWAVVDFLGVSLDLVLLFHDAHKADHLPPNAISLAAPAKEICRRRNHRRGIRRTADQAPARRKYEIGRVFRVRTAIVADASCYRTLHASGDGELYFTLNRLKRVKDGSY